MIIPDANLLIYAVNSDAYAHTSTRKWIEHILSSDEQVGFTWVVLMAFVRITTHPRIMQRPLVLEKALSYIDAWLQQPCALIVNPGDKHWMILRHLLLHAGTGGNLSSDAHLAAISIEYGATLYSADNDFKRFKDIQHVNPIGENLHEVASYYATS